MIDGKTIAEKFKGKGKKTIFFLGLAGILLVYLSSFSSGGEENAEKVKDTYTVATEYCALTEEKIRDLVISITGSKKVSVAVTLDTGNQYIYADEGRTTVTDKSNDSEQGYIIVKSADGAESGLLVTEYMPTVRGVAIVCDTVSEETEQRVRSAVMAALDISGKKIYVTQYVN